MQTMYKVILVDDDYPVLEFLSKALDWEQLGLTLQGVFENGLSAWEHAQQALKLHVQDYLLKETLDPIDLQKLLVQFVESLQAERSIHVQQTKLQHTVDRNK